jgi:tetratricopeptide (TPR) repeat protein
MMVQMSLVDQTLKEFQLLTRRYAFFHAAFLAAFVVELLILLIFTQFLSKTLLFSIVVALAFLTVFTYLVLRFYFQTKKPEQFVALRNKFLTAALNSPWEPMQKESASRWSVEKLHPIYELLQKLHGQESQYYSLPSFLKTLSPLVEKFSVWCHWEDVQWMKETLHLHALRKLFDWVKVFPTDLELHRTLAASYIALYQIYQMPEDTASAFYSFIKRQYELPETKDRFEKAARSAVEELKVVLTYASSDAWALSQIAKVYHDLGLRQEERITYEALLSLKPQDSEIHYRLGKLYFELGHMAQGLHLYQELQGRKDPKAGELMQHYDSYYNTEILDS